MNPDDFEAQLGRRPAPQLPGEWRDAILSAAESARHEQTRSEEDAIESRSSGYLRWGTLAAVWVAIGLIATFEPAPETPGTLAVAPNVPDQIEQRWQERIRLLAEWAEPPAAPPPAAMPRRRSGFHPVRLKTFA